MIKGLEIVLQVCVAPAKADRILHREQLAPLLKDGDGGVRVAAALARCRLGATPQDVTLLAREVENDNRVVGMYAIRALELIGPDLAAQQAAVIKAAQQSPYEFTRRIARRLTAKLGDADEHGAP